MSGSAMIPVLPTSPPTRLQHAFSRMPHPNPVPNFTPQLISPVSTATKQQLEAARMEAEAKERNVINRGSGFSMSVAAAKKRRSSMQDDDAQLLLPIPINRRATMQVMSAVSRRASMGASIAAQQSEEKKQDDTKVEQGSNTSNDTPSIGVSIDTTAATAPTVASSPPSPGSVLAEAVHSSPTLLQKEAISILQKINRTESEVDTVTTWVRNQSIEFFQDVDVETIRLLCQRMHYRVCERKEVVMREGTMADALFILVDGSVSIWNESFRDFEAIDAKLQQKEQKDKESNNADAAKPLQPAEGQARNLTELIRLLGRKPKQITIIYSTPTTKPAFGELGLMSDQLRTATVIAEGPASNPTCFLIIDKADFDSVLKRRQKDKFVEKLDVLKKIRVFSTVSERQLVKISIYFEQLLFPRGTTIIQQGSVADMIYFIVSGEVDILEHLALPGGISGNALRSSESVHLGILGEGELITDAAVFETLLLHPWEIRARNDVTVYAISSEDFNKRIRADILVNIRRLSYAKKEFRETLRKISYRTKKKLYVPSEKLQQAQKLLAQISCEKPATTTAATTNAPKPARGTNSSLPRSVRRTLLKNVVSGTSSHDNKAVVPSSASSSPSTTANVAAGSTTSIISGTAGSSNARVIGELDEETGAVFIPGYSARESLAHMMSVTRAQSPKQATKSLVTSRPVSRATVVQPIATSQASTPRGALSPRAPSKAHTTVNTRPFTSPVISTTSSSASIVEKTADGISIRFSQTSAEHEPLPIVVSDDDSEHRTKTAQSMLADSVSSSTTTLVGSSLADLSVASVAGPPGAKGMLLVQKNPFAYDNDHFISPLSAGKIASLSASTRNLISVLTAPDAASKDHRSSSPNRRTAGGPNPMLLSNVQRAPYPFDHIHTSEGTTDSPANASSLESSPSLTPSQSHSALLQARRHARGRSQSISMQLGPGGAVSFTTPDGGVHTIAEDPSADTLDQQPSSARGEALSARDHPNSLTPREPMSARKGSIIGGAGGRAIIQSQIHGHQRSMSSHRGSIVQASALPFAIGPALPAPGVAPSIVGSDSSRPSTSSSSVPSVAPVSSGLNDSQLAAPKLIKPALSAAAQNSSMTPAFLPVNENIAPVPSFAHMPTNFYTTVPDKQYYGKLEFRRPSALLSPSQIQQAMSSSLSPASGGGSGSNSSLPVTSGALGGAMGQGTGFVKAALLTAAPTASSSSEAGTDGVRKDVSASGSGDTSTLTPSRRRPSIFGGQGRGSVFALKDPTVSQSAAANVNNALEAIPISASPSRSSLNSDSTPSSSSNSESVASLKTDMSATSSTATLPATNHGPSNSGGGMNTARAFKQGSNMSTAGSMSALPLMVTASQIDSDEELDRAVAAELDPATRRKALLASTVAALQLDPLLLHKEGLKWERQLDAWHRKLVVASSAFLQIGLGLPDHVADPSLISSSSFGGSETRAPILTPPHVEIFTTKRELTPAQMASPLSLLPKAFPPRNMAHANQPLPYLYPTQREIGSMAQTRALNAALEGMSETKKIDQISEPRKAHPLAGRDTPTPLIITGPPIGPLPTANHVQLRSPDQLLLDPSVELPRQVISDAEAKETELIQRVKYMPVSRPTKTPSKQTAKRLRILAQEAEALFAANGRGIHGAEVYEDEDGEYALSRSWKRKSADIGLPSRRTKEQKAKDKELREFKKKRQEERERLAAEEKSRRAKSPSYLLDHDDDSKQQVDRNSNDDDSNSPAQGSSPNPDSDVLYGDGIAAPVFQPEPNCMPLPGWKVRPPAKEEEAKRAQIEKMEQEALELNFVTSLLTDNDHTFLKVLFPPPSRTISNSATAGFDASDATGAEAVEVSAALANMLQGALLGGTSSGLDYVASPPPEQVSTNPSSPRGLGSQNRFSIQIHPTVTFAEDVTTADGANPLNMKVDTPLSRGGSTPRLKNSNSNRGPLLTSDQRLLHAGTRELTLDRELDYGVEWRYFEDRAPRKGKEEFERALASGGGLLPSSTEGGVNHVQVETVRQVLRSTQGSAIELRPDFRKVLVALEAAQIEQEKEAAEEERRRKEAAESNKQVVPFNEEDEKQQALVRLVAQKEQQQEQYERDQARLEQAIFSHSSLTSASLNRDPLSMEPISSNKRPLFALTSHDSAAPSQLGSAAPRLYHWSAAQSVLQAKLFGGGPTPRNIGTAGPATSPRHGLAPNNVEMKDMLTEEALSASLHQPIPLPPPPSGPPKRPPTLAELNSEIALYRRDLRVLRRDIHAHAGGTTTIGALGDESSQRAVGLRMQAARQQMLHNKQQRDLLGSTQSPLSKIMKLRMFHGAHPLTPTGSLTARPSTSHSGGGESGSGSYTARPGTSAASGDLSAGAGSVLDDSVEASARRFWRQSFSKRYWSRNGLQEYAEHNLPHEATTATSLSSAAVAFFESTGKKKKGSKPDSASSNKGHDDDDDDADSPVNNKRQLPGKIVPPSPSAAALAAAAANQAAASPISDTLSLPNLSPGSSPFANSLAASTSHTNTNSATALGIGFSSASPSGTPLSLSLPLTFPAKSPSSGRDGALVARLSDILAKTKPSTVNVLVDPASSSPQQEFYRWINKSKKKNNIFTMCK